MLQAHRQCSVRLESLRCRIAQSCQLSRMFDRAFACLFIFCKHTTVYVLQVEPQAPEERVQNAALDELERVPSGLRTADGNESDAEGSVREGPPVLNPMQLISSAAIYKPAACARQPCRRDLSEQVAGHSSWDAFTHEGEGSRATGVRKRPSSTEHGCFRYGNYHRCSFNNSAPLHPMSCKNARLSHSLILCRYYGYRVTQDFEEDPRLQHLDQQWFAGKSMIDIGCNDGLLTMSLACKFGCQSVMGVDIDSQLISKACRSLSGLRTKYTKDIAAASNGSKCVLFVFWCCRALLPSGKDATASNAVLKASTVWHAACLLHAL